MDGVILSAKVPTEIAESVRQIAATEDRSVSSVIRRSLTAAVSVAEEQGGANGKRETMSEQKKEKGHAG